MTAQTSIRFTIRWAEAQGSFRKPILAVYRTQQENEAIYEVLEKSAPKTAFCHSTELDWTVTVVALFRAVFKAPDPETLALNTVTKTRSLLEFCCWLCH